MGKVYTVHANCYHLCRQSWKYADVSSPMLAHRKVKVVNIGELITWE